MNLMKLFAVLAMISVMGLTGCIPVSLTVTATPGDPSLTTPARPASAASPFPAASPTPAVVIQAETLVPQAQSDEMLSNVYQWTYKGKEWAWELQVPLSFYDYFKQLPRSPTSDYSVYVTHPLDDTYVGRLATRMRDSAAQERYSEFETVELAASFVQSLPYVPDNVSTSFDEYPRYPVETLVDNGGDCEDTSILLAALLRQMGYEVVLLRFTPTADYDGHLAIGVAGGDGILGTYWEYESRKYYYLETTGDGWEIGQIPDEYRSASATVLPMRPVPVLTHAWTATGSPGAATLEVSISNLGSAAAEGTYVYAGFDAGDDRLWNAGQSAPVSIGVDEKVTLTMTLRVPDGKHTRIVVQIIYDGHAVDESYSEWVDT